MKLLVIHTKMAFAICTSCVKPNEIEHLVPISLGDEHDSPPSCDRCNKHIEINCLHTESTWELNGKPHEAISWGDEEVEIEMKRKCVCDSDDIETWTYKRVEDDDIDPSVHSAIRSM